MSFEDLGLSTELLRAVREQNYSEPTPIQTQAIPAILEGRDILAGAQTGTGKTASFTLPLLQRLMQSWAANREQAPDVGKKKFRFVRALIVTPTRELAGQVSASVQTYGKYLPLRSNVVFGGVRIQSQIFKLQRGADVLVATPGRLLDLVNQRVIDLSKVEILVLDEADRMLDMGFMPDIQRIISLMPKQRQNLLFSATYSTHIKKLANDLLTSPKVIDIGSGNSVASKISHTVHPVSQERKRQLLSYLIGFNDWKQVLVFTKTKHGADRLAKQLESDGLRSVAIHGDKTQGARSQALEKFKQGRVRVMVATDVAARGLDIPQLSHVVNYELPLVAEDYIHRIGRTGRAGNEGNAISLMGADERHLLRDIEQLLKKSVSKSVVEGYEPDFSLTAPVKSDGPRKKSQSRRYGNGGGNGNSRSNGNGPKHRNSDRKQNGGESSRDSFGNRDQRDGNKSQRDRPQKNQGRPQANKAGTSSHKPQRQNRRQSTAA